MTSGTQKPVELSILSSPANLPAVRAAVEKVCRNVGFDSDAVGDIVLSVDEALTNIIRHAYKGAEGQPIDVKLTPIGGRQPKAIKICLADRGRYMDPARFKPRDLEQVQPGGLGVHIITKCMDQVRYEAREGGGTLLTMVKDINSQRLAEE